MKGTNAFYFGKKVIRNKLSPTKVYKGLGFFIIDVNSKLTGNEANYMPTVTIGFWHSFGKNTRNA